MIAEKVIAELDAFVPADESENVGYLYEILAQLKPLAPELRTSVIPAILRLIENYPEAELGAPGPLVHELESIPGYDSFLRDSVLRQPTDLNIWMVNRILNSKISIESRSNWLQVLRSVLKHPLASKESRQTAREFLEHQNQ